MPPTDQWKYFVYWVDCIRITLITTLICSLVMAAWFQTSLWYCLAYLRYCQVTLHLPMLATPVTLNLLQFCATLLAFPRFDIFNWIWSRETHWGYFDFDEHYLLKAWIADQQEDIGYRTHNTLINLSTLAVALLVYVCLWGAYWILRAFQPCCSRMLNKERSKKLAKFLEWSNKQLFYRWLFALFLFGFMEFVIAGFLGMYKPLDTYPNETMGNLTAYVSLCVPLVGIPAVYIWLHEERGGYYDEDKDFKRMFPSSVTHFSVSTKKPASFFFYPIYIAHRVIYLLLILVFTTPSSQFLMMFTLNWLQMFYVGKWKPMKGKKPNYYETFCEMSISLVTLMVAYYRVSSDDIEKQWLYGDIIIGIILTHAFLSLLVIWYYLFKHGWLLL